jgi:CheY-like chemotaxis protein
MPEKWNDDMAGEADLEELGPVPSRVLLVEDNAIVAMNAEELLLEIGATEVMVAKTVAEAQAFCDQHAFDFALLDLNLGHETSISVAIRLHEAKVPFAFASGLHDRDQLPASLGRYPILRKPYLLSDLERMVRSPQFSD